MLVAYPMRIDALEKPGGDLSQILKYKEQGRRAGEGLLPRYEGYVLTDIHADLSKYDVIHLTNVDRPVDTYCYFLSAKAARKPVVFSTIHHSYSEIEQFERLGRGGLVGSFSGLLGFRTLELLRSGVRSRRNAQLALPTLRMMLGGMRRSQQEVLAGVDRILVLTEKERVDLIQDLGEIPEEKFVCLRNGFESESRLEKDSIVRDIDVCMVGRIEARKNQILVLRVLKHLGIQGVFIGAENPYHSAYCREFKELVVDSGSKYLGALSHKETLQVMRRSRVHVSASWFEVLSMVDLEAYSVGCGVVASRCGGTAEVLGDDAEYVYPDSEKSIEVGIRRVLDRDGKEPAECATKNKKPLCFDTWEQIGDKLVSIYQECIEART